VTRSATIPGLLDAHAHLTEAPRDAPTWRGWIVPGVDGARDAAAPRGPRIANAVGLHPWSLDGDLDQALAALSARAAEPGVVAIGETGLDAMRRAGPRDRQERAFRWQIALARERRLPLILHVVRRHGACLAALREQGFPADLGGMVHDFGGPAEVVTEWVSAGFALSISPRSLDREDRVRAVAAIPEAHLLVETDDAGYARLPEVVRWVARARGETSEHVAEVTAANAARIFAV
jgi:TatD DNase family protein